jgi:hypothetical protein
MDDLDNGERLWYSSLRCKYTRFPIPAWVLEIQVIAGDEEGGRKNP